jgi:outer membrane lipoprotein-sorting protein
MEPTENIKRLLKKLNFNADPQVHQRILDDALAAQAKAKTLESPAASTAGIWRIIMKSPITKLATAAGIVLAVAIGLQMFKPANALAVEVFAQATKAMANLQSVYIKAQMRTIPHDNFTLILLDHEFVPLEIWKQYDTGNGKWRIEKPGRVVVMDGKSSIMLIRPNRVAAKGSVRTGMIDWLRPFLDIDKLLDCEIQLAQEQGSELLLTREKGIDGSDKLVVTVEAAAQGDFSNDWLKNKSISASNNRRVYRFDARTKLLEDLKVSVHTGTEDVLVFEITNIQYNIAIDPSLFTLELPKDVIWYGQPKILPDNEKYEQMTPKESAKAFFQACSDKNWDEATKFWDAIADETVRQWLGGLEIIEIGEPFKSGLYPGWFVPYQVKFKSGHIKKFNLAIRNDNQAHRYVVDGGI